MLGLIAGLVLAKALAPDGRGLLAIATVWPGIAVTLLGLPGNQAVAFFAARRPGSRSQVVWVACEQTAATGVLILVIGLGGGWVLLHDNSQLLLAMLVAFLGTPFLLITGIGRGLLKVTDLRSWSRQRLAQPSFYAVVVLVAAASGHLTLLAGAAIFTLSQVAGAASVWWLALRATPPRREPAASGLRWSMLSYGLKSNVAGSAQVTNARLDVAVIGLVVPASQVGFYAVATSLSGYLVPLATAAAPWVFPRLARVTPTAASWVEARRAIRLSAVLAGLGAALMALLAPLLLGRVLGPEWVPALVPLWILLVAAVVQSVRQTLISIAGAFNRPGLTAQSEGVAAAVTLSGLWPMVHFFGINGAATVSLVAYSVSSILLGRAIARTARAGEPIARAPRDVIEGSSG